MDNLPLLTTHLLSPPILAFAGGLAVRRLVSRAGAPAAVTHALSSYLLLAIGLKGGLALAGPGGALPLPALGAVLLAGTLIPLGVFLTARRCLRWAPPEAGALAAHYGSVSAVTFMAALALLEHRGLEAAPWSLVLLALLEFPAIAMALGLVRLTDPSPLRFGHVLAEMFTGRPFLLLAGGLVAGWACARLGFAGPVQAVLAPFYWVLVPFLFCLGLFAGRYFPLLFSGPRGLLGFALAAPLVQGGFGLLLAAFCGFPAGAAALFAVLCGSASYIAAPAAIRLALPQADLAPCLAASIAVTFPFNLAIGLPLWTGLATHFLAP